MLPLNATYFDEITDVQGTNGKLIYYLTLDENSNYNYLESNETGNNIISKIAGNPKIRLLLDAGALMVDLENKQVVEQWLILSKENDNIKAGVYFKDNDLFVVERNGRVTSFELSPYKFQLSECVIYLDDIHTRGTDLKIPKDTIGAVTLGKGLTKDKLVQVFFSQ